MKIMLWVFLTIIFWNVSKAQLTSFELTYGTYFQCNEPITIQKQKIHYPVIEIKNDSFAYTCIQKSSKYKEIEIWGLNNEHADTIWIYDTIAQHMKFRKSSVDSIVAIIKNQHDTIIYGNAPLMRYCNSNSILTINNHGKKLKYEMFNTGDSTISYQILTIINTYLTDEYKIPIYYNLWKEDYEYWKREGLPMPDTWW